MNTILNILLVAAVIGTVVVIAQWIYIDHLLTQSILK